MQQEEKNTQTLSNREIRESGVMPQIVQAMEHDPMDNSAIDPVSAYTAIEHGVVATYKTIEQGVVNAWNAVEKGAVEAYQRVEDAMVDKLFRREGETIQQTKDRLNKKKG